MDAPVAVGSRLERFGPVATLWTVLVVAPFAGLADRVWWIAIAGGAVVVTGGAIRSRRWPLAHAGLAASLVMVSVGSGVLGPWPLPLIVALVVYAGVVGFRSGPAGQFRLGAVANAAG